MAMDGAEYARLSALFAEVSGSTQTLHGGFLALHEDDTAAATAAAASVQLVWSKKDLVNNASVKYHAQHHVSALTSEAPVVHGGAFPSSWDAALTSVSPSKRFVVTVKMEKSKDNGSAPAEGVFNVFENGVLTQSFRAPSSLHGAIYTGEREGGITWSHDESRIAYVAEKKSAETSPLWENVNTQKKKKKNQPVDASVEDDEATEARPGSKYEYEDDWGEQYVGKKTGAIFVATLATGAIEAVKGVPANITCADVLFTPGDDGLVFAGTEVDAPRRLGIVYCYNRPITLYHVDLPVNVEKKQTNEEESSQRDESTPVATKIALKPVDAASQQIASMRSPRFSRDGKSLAFLATRDVVTHSTCSLLAVMDWETKATRTVIDVVMEPEHGYTQRPTSSFNGLFVGRLAPNCWSKDGQYIFFGTQLGARQLWKYVDVTTGVISHPAYVDGPRIAMESILDRSANDDWALVSVSSPLRAASVFLVHLDLTTGKYRQAPIAIVDQSGASTHMGEWHVVSVPTSVADAPAEESAKARQQRQLDDEKQEREDPVLSPHLLPLTTSNADFEASVWLPSTPPPVEGYPVVLDLHGGPHGNSPVMYRVMYEYMAALGFAIVSVNYRGSTGYGLGPLESLIGRVGSQDVDDCHFGLLHVLEHGGYPLNRRNVHCSGGSHGGFLVSHLITQFPGFYRSTVARNPVENIVSQFFTSDIPDWGLAVTGVARFDAITTSQQQRSQVGGTSALPYVTPATRAAIVAKLWRHSPLAQDVGAVTTPVLFGIGGKDRRVPSTQGLEMRDALAATGKAVTRVLWYPEDNHPLDTLQAFGDFSVNWAAWLMQYSA